MRLLRLLILAVAVAGEESSYQEFEGTYGAVQHGASPMAIPVMGRRHRCIEANY